MAAARIETLDRRYSDADKADDWKGLADKAERRKRQNRLHQRAWRRRKALEASAAALAAAEGNPSSGFWVLKPVAQQQSQPSQQQLQLYEGPQQQYFVLTKEALLTPSSSSSSASPTGFMAGRVKLIPPLLHYTSGKQPLTNLPLFVLPAAFVHFPLSLDHRLLTLIQYNVLRATLTNMSILAILHAMDTDCGLDQIMDQIQPPLPPPAASPDQIPEALKPTPLQKQVFDAHSDMLWISSVPSPAMRDNLIRTYGQWDPDDLCCDLLGGLYEGFNDVERRGMIVWSDPWRPEGWEVTAGFARKWGFLLRGCGELLAATDRWRAERGEEPLVVEWED
ncbi:hypothetical protein SEUCBS139899_003645 [Sporothrix eucalyptigena]|uniref:BZIP domain-containing protein n=1 Tax=Sporothrix eucalyptigena TaxID=1812306 RepID=A0ABP0CQE0_9PEZI